MQRQSNSKRLEILILMELAELRQPDHQTKLGSDNNSTNTRGNVIKSCNMLLPIDNNEKNALCCAIILNDFSYWVLKPFCIWFVFTKSTVHSPDNGEVFQSFHIHSLRNFPPFYLCENPLKCMFFVRSLNITSYLRKSLQRATDGAIHDVWSETSRFMLLKCGSSRSLCSFQSHEK